MAYLFGLAIAVLSFVSAVIHLQQPTHFFWDFVAFACVFGGTIAVMCITTPWSHYRVLLASVGQLLGLKRVSESQCVHEGIEFVRLVYSGANSYTKRGNNIWTQIYRDGIELIGLGFSKEKIQEILEERIYQNYERTIKIANVFRSMAKYPPAFGLAGTVLGLVNIMREMAVVADAKKTGLMMAHALIATLYGLLLSNLLLNPVGENLVKAAQVDRKAADIALRAVLLAVDRATLLEAQEVLNSYVEPQNRINIIGSFSAEAA